MMVALRAEMAVDRSDSCAFLLGFLNEMNKNECTWIEGEYIAISA